MHRLHTKGPVEVTNKNRLFILRLLYIDNVSMKIGIKLKKHANVPLLAWNSTLSPTDTKDDVKSAYLKMLYIDI